MPTWGVEYGGPMTQQMVDDVIAYLKSLPGNQSAPPALAEGCDDPEPTDYMSCGEEIFEARCAVCHGSEGQGKEAKGLADVRILDVFEKAAVARIDASEWVDYLQMARWNGRWVIVNVLWGNRPR